MRAKPRLSIPTRVFLAFALVLTAFGGVAAASLVQHQRTAQRLRLLHEGYLPLALSIGEARATQTVFGTLLDRVLEERDSAATRGWLGAARIVRPSGLRRALGRVDRAERLGPSADERRVLETVRAHLQTALRDVTADDARIDELFGALRGGDDTRAKAILDGLREHESRIDREIRKAWTILQDQIAATSANAEAQERASAETLAVLALLALVVGVALTWWSRRLLAPLPRLEERVAAVARGDLSRRLEPIASDEIGRVAVEFERMVDAVASRDASLRDAAERLRGLQRMQEQIVAGLRAAVVLVDADGVVRSANPAAGAILGVGRDAVSSPLSSTGLLDRVPGLSDAMAAVAAGDERAALADVRLAGDEARRLDVLVTPFGLETAGTGALGVLVVVEDVTDELRTKERLIQTERLAAVGRMAAHVTHEVRNPLSSIGLNVELLEDELGGAGPEARTLLRAIHREIDRLTAITEEYLRLARLPQPRLEPEDLGALVAEVARFVAPEHERAGITITVDREPELPSVRVDEPQVRQALLNLLRNAREAMPRGGRVALSVARASGGVAVRVSDEGPGIPAAERERIFDPFYTTKERGTGLGLPLTQQIVLAHGGRIRCDAAKERGTVFELWFPAAEPAPAAAAARDAAAE